MKKYKVKWIVADKRLIKFYEDNEPYEIANDVDLNDIKSNMELEAEIVNNIVVKIVLKSDKKEIKKEEPTNSVVWTVKAKTSNGEAIKFNEQEEEKTWFPVHEDIQNKVKILNRGDKVEISLADVIVTSQQGKKYPKKGVVLLKQFKEEKKVEEIKEEVKQTTSYRNSTNESIEKQVALKGAIEVVVALIEKDKLVKDDIEKTIKDLTKSCLDAIREI